MLDPGATGEIEVLSPSAMAGYLPDSETAAAFHDGWYRTGDIGWMEPEGWLHITDRLKEMIKVRGFQVAPAEIEAVLHADPRVRDCAVFGVDDAELGEAVVAAVVVVPDAVVTAEELQGAVAEQLAGYKRIRHVVMVDEIPRLPSGKALRRRLKEAVARRSPVTAAADPRRLAPLLLEDLAGFPVDPLELVLREVAASSFSFGASSRAVTWPLSGIGDSSRFLPRLLRTARSGSPNALGGRLARCFAVSFATMHLLPIVSALDPDHVEQADSPARSVRSVRAVGCRRYRSARSELLRGRCPRGVCVDAAQLAGAFRREERMLGHRDVRRHP